MKIYLILMMMCSSLLAENGMSEKQAEELVELALAGLNREYPNKPGQVMKTAEDVISPREMSPVFFGHFDWHSSVHGHWTLVRMLRHFPKAEWNAKVRAALDAKLTKQGLQKEADRLAEHPSFERMYGWAWALRLGLELRALDDEQGKRWAAAYLPLEQVIVGHAKAYLPKLDWPVRCGFHPESGFPLSQMLDWARGTGDDAFEKMLVSKARQFYGKDSAYPVRYEPSGNDFFSPGLNEADLMRRVLPAAEFRQWLAAFFPNFDLGNLSQPVSVSDLDDGHLVHLVGLNLSRAWTMRGIAGVLDGPEKATLLEAAKKHQEAGLKDTFSGSYEGEHWLGSFAVYLLTGVGQ
ncbi:DUF2891 domain-containing protein [Verrucomicrobiaceae bacterium R5-34]|nr:DUF2891 domain-containing protein [Verrucomicrobiaceae bacterium R5-34]